MEIGNDSTPRRFAVYRFYDCFGSLCVVRREITTTRKKGMMKVYRINTPFNHSQVSCVVAETMAEAESAFLKEYPYTKINSIELYSEYVLIAKGTHHAQG